MLSFKVNGENGVLTKQLMQSMLNGNCDVIFNYYYFFFWNNVPIFCKYYLGHLNVNENVSIVCANLILK